MLPSTGSEKVVIGITNRNTLPAVAGILGKRMVTSGGIGALCTQENQPANQLSNGHVRVHEKKLTKEF